MPVVPFTARSNQSQPLPKVDQTYLMMAAAELHEAGRLIEPELEAVPSSGGKGRFNALERVGKGYQPPPVKPVPSPEDK